MPEFVLRYKRGCAAQADQIALAVQAEAAKAFGMEVVFETKVLGKNSGLSTFCVTGWVTDNEDKLQQKVVFAQAEILATMQKLAYQDQSVECW